MCAYVRACVRACVCQVCVRVRVSYVRVRVSYTCVRMFEGMCLFMCGIVRTCVWLCGCGPSVGSRPLPITGRKHAGHYRSVILLSRQEILHEFARTHNRTHIHTHTHLFRIQISGARAHTMRIRTHTHTPLFRIRILHELAHTQYALTRTYTYSRTRTCSGSCWPQTATPWPLIQEHLPSRLVR